MITMQYDPELFEAVKAILVKAHEAWGDYTAAGAAYAILEEVEKHSEDAKLGREIQQAVKSATSRPDAMRAIRLILENHNLPSGLRDAVDRLDFIRTFPPEPSRWQEIYDSLNE
jgi:hypothetical protein